MQCAPGPSSGQPGAVAWILALGSVSGSSCFLVLARQAWSRALAPWEHKVQRGQTANSKAPQLQFSSHPLQSTLPASTLSAVTRHQGQVWPEGVIGSHTRSLLSSSPLPPLPGATKAGPVFCFVLGDAVHYTFSCSGPTCCL